ncbi:hypothetical protein ANTPLA_LOCUS7411 [Anthophora plagiata]
MPRKKKEEEEEEEEENEGSQLYSKRRTLLEFWKNDRETFQRNSSRSIAVRESARPNKREEKEKDNEEEKRKERINKGSRIKEEERKEW